MPPRKPFRPDKNRDRGRAQHGSRPRAGEVGRARTTGRRSGRSGTGSSAPDERRVDAADIVWNRRIPRRSASPPATGAKLRRLQSQRRKLLDLRQSCRPGRDRQPEAPDPAPAAGRAPSREGGARRQRPHPARLGDVDRAILDRVAGRESVHQGIAAQVDPLPETEVEDIAAWPPTGRRRRSSSWTR